MEHVDASPTKEFFIEMLTRDIKLEKAILDLIDNSIDGAKKTTEKEDFTNLFIHINLNKEKFQIIDNCGGFDKDTAINYAFKFGRSPQSTNVSHSVGRFGVGMKRALFKMGKKFTVESKCKGEHFVVDVDVTKWSKTQEWTFDIITESFNQKFQLKSDAEDGTIVTVESLYENIMDEFNSNYFISNLKSEIERFMYYSIEKGISIKLNDINLRHTPLKMLYSDNLKPISKQLFYLNDKVKVKIVAGIGEANPDLSGWYIYCNDRLVLEKDKTNLTGWEGRIFDESKMVKWHHQYAMFRGLVFFDSEDPTLLPMTTTKIGIDSNSAIYRSVKLEMIDVMGQISNFLKKLKDDEDREEVTADAEELTIEKIKSFADNIVFNAITPDRIKLSNKLGNISYKKDKKIIDTVKKHTGMNSNSELGSFTFDYYYQHEIEG